MNTNPYRALLALLPEPVTDVGEIIAVHAGGCTVQILSGDQVEARGAGSIGDLVYLRDGAIQGPAPVIDTVEIEV